MVMPAVPATTGGDLHIRPKRAIMHISFIAWNSIMSKKNTPIPKLKPLPRSGARRHEQAHFIWIALSGWVQHHRGETITYGQLAELLGYEPQAGRTLAEPLGAVSLYCLYNGLPPLSCIVVGRNSNSPGWEGMIPDGSSLVQEQKRASKVSWHHFRTPTPGTFRRVREELDWDEFM